MVVAHGRVSDRNHESQMLVLSNTVTVRRATILQRYTDGMFRISTQMIGLVKKKTHDFWPMLDRTSQYVSALPVQIVPSDNTRSLRHRLS
jgi:hypothetical protein